MNDNDARPPWEPSSVVSDDTLNPITSVIPPPIPSMRPSARPPGRPSLYSLMPRPRWKPWTPSQVILASIAFSAFMGMLIAVAPSALTLARSRIFGAPKAAAAAAPAETKGPEVVPAGEPDRADVALDRKGRSPIAGGLLTIPPAFTSERGEYDLVVHFHGNTDLVEESYQIAGLDAVVVIFNFGNGSGAYEDRLSNPGFFPEVLNRVQRTLEKRGLRNASLRRLGLTAWSAGYGAVLKILDQPAMADAADAVLLLDGIHCGYAFNSKELYLEKIAPFTRFAQRAVAGEKLFAITHSEITPLGSYAGTRETTDALLRLVDVERAPAGEAPALPKLTSIEGVIAKSTIQPLEPKSEASRGGLHVLGFAGDQAKHHTMHLVQMATTALPDLRRRWSTR